MNSFIDLIHVFIFNIILKVTFKIVFVYHRSFTLHIFFLFFLKHKVISIRQFILECGIIARKTISSNNFLTVFEIFRFIVDCSLFTLYCCIWPYHALDVLNKASLNIASYQITIFILQYLHKWENVPLNFFFLC